MIAKRILRWLAIAGFGTYGTYSFVSNVLHISAQPDVHWAVFCFFLLPFLLVYCGTFIAIAYFIGRRQYQHLCTLISALAAVIVFGFLISLFNWFGLQERLLALRDSPWFMLMLPLSFSALLMPFYAARWTYRYGSAFLSRFVHNGTQPARAG